MFTTHLFLYLHSLGLPICQRSVLLLQVSTIFPDLPLFPMLFVSKGDPQLLLISLDLLEVEFIQTFFQSFIYRVNMCRGTIVSCAMFLGWGVCKGQHSPHSRHLPACLGKQIRNKQTLTPMMAGDRVAEVMGGIQREWGRGSLVRWPEEASEQGTIKHCR